jgi:hypothetical protein
MFERCQRLPRTALLIAVVLLLLPMLGTMVQAQGAMLDLSATRLVFSAVQNTTSADKQVVLTNTGTAPLALGAPTVLGEDAASFIVSASGGLPRTLAPHESLSVSLHFSPAAGAAQSPNDPALAATLTIPVSGDDDLQIGLAGLALRGLSGTSEPSLQEILNAYQLTVDVDDADPYTNALGRSALQWGDEVPAQQLRKVGPGPVTVEVVAVFGPKGADEVARFGWYAAASPDTRHELFVVPRDPAVPTTNNATLQPHIDGVTIFDPGTAPFGIYSIWPFFDAAGTAPRSQGDALNTWEPNLSFRHKVRVYPFRSTVLSDEPNAYVLAMEEQTSGQDYQDIVVILRNVQPVPPVLSLEFDQTYPGTLVDRAGRPMGFISTQPRLNPQDTISATGSYDPARIALHIGGTGTLVVTTTKTSSAQGASAGWNNLVNALQLPFDGTQPFTVTARLLGPLDNLIANTQQAGIFLGSSQATYVKLVAARLNNRNVIEFRNEINDVEHRRAELTLDDNGGLANIAALDLTITADPTTRELRASYRKELLSGGVETKSFSLEIIVPTSNATDYFDSASQAGLTFSARGSDDIQTSFRFDRFAISYAPGAAPTATSTPTHSPTHSPTHTPSASPPATSTSAPGETPSASPSATSTSAPGETPSASPSATSTSAPGETPSASAPATSTSAPGEPPSATASATPTPTGGTAAPDDVMIYLPLVQHP